MPLRRYAEKLEEIYEQYNQPRYISPDPLELVGQWDDPAEAEVVGLVASSLAYGRVEQILISSRLVLDRLGPSPREAICGLDEKALADRLAGWRHRFQRAADMAALLSGAGAMIRRHGSLGEAFAESRRRSEDLIEALTDWTGRIDPARRCGHLLADPSRRSACKRLMLYLRWMIRSDAVDPGCWDCMDPSELIVPLDTHMHAIATRLHATARKSADLRTAREITAAFARIRPDDPVRYDFALTRWGIRRQMDRSELLDRIV